MICTKGYRSDQNVTNKEANKLKLRIKRWHFDCFRSLGGSMKKIGTLIILFLISSCGKSNKEILETVKDQQTQEEINSIVTEMTYPASNQLEFEGEILADFSTSAPVTSSFGTVQKSVVLNLLIIQGKEFLVYGEDGVFATECEPSVDYPDHGPSHPKCQTAHGESFDKIILCTSSNTSTPAMTAQNWPGSVTAMTDNRLGMRCWVNGVKMLSDKIFTY